MKAERSPDGFVPPGFGSVRKNGERFDVNDLELLIDTKPSIETDPLRSKFSHEQVDAAVVNVGNPCRRTDSTVTAAIAGVSPNMSVCRAIVRRKASTDSALVGVFRIAMSPRTQPSISLATTIVSFVRGRESAREATRKASYSPSSRS